MEICTWLLSSKRKHKTNIILLHILDVYPLTTTTTVACTALSCRITSVAPRQGRHFVA